MKIAAILLFLVFSFFSSAHSQDTKNFGKMMQEMQKCMAQVDQEKIAKLEKESEEMEATFRALCEQGRRDEAQGKAIKYNKKMMANPTVVKMRECSEIVKAFVPEGAMEEEDEDFDPSKHHVCDDMY